MEFRNLARDLLSRVTEAGGDANCEHCKEYRNRVRKIGDELEQGNMTDYEAWDKYCNVSDEKRCTHRWDSLLNHCTTWLFYKAKDIYEVRDKSRKECDSVLEQINVLEENNRNKTAKRYQRLRGFARDEFCAEMQDIDAHAEECRDLENDFKVFATKQSGLTKRGNMSQSVEAKLKKERDELMRAFFKVMSFKLPEPLKFQLSYHSDTVQVTRISSRGRKSFPALEEETVVKRSWARSLVSLLAF